MTGINRSEQQVRAFMKRHGLKFIKCGHIPSKADNETQHQWMESFGTHLLFLPPYSPNLNIIERWWKFTKKKTLYAKYYNKPKEFHEAIQSFFIDINQNFQEELKSLLSLKFQFFDNKKSLIYPL